jgi:hypothetical protein
MTYYIRNSLTFNWCLSLIKMLLYFFSRNDPLYMIFLSNLGCTCLGNFSAQTNTARFYCSVERAEPYIYARWMHAGISILSNDPNTYIFVQGTNYVGWNSSFAIDKGLWHIITCLIMLTVLSGLVANCFAFCMHAFPKRVPRIWDKINSAHYGNNFFIK